MHVQLQRREVCWKFVSTHAAFGKGIYEKVETQVIKVYIHESSVIKSIKNIYYDTISCNEWIHPISQAHIIGRQRTSQDIMQYLLQASGHWAWGGSDGGMAFVPPKRPNLNAVQAPRCIHVMELRTINLRSCLCDAGCLLCFFFGGHKESVGGLTPFSSTPYSPTYVFWQAQAGAAAATLLVRHEPQLLSPFSFTLFQILRQLLVCEICYPFWPV